MKDNIMRREIKRIDGGKKKNARRLSMQIIIEKNKTLQICSITLGF